MIKLKYLRNLFSKFEGDTIYALATNHSKPSPVNILRISGSNSYKCLNMISKNTFNLNTKQQYLNKHKIKPRYAHNTTLYSMEQRIPIDKCLLLYFPEGKSYNGQDIFQLHLHGSPAITKLTVSELNKLGFRLAEPGEFTKRAFLNDKMNLLQIEGLHQLIHSQNQFSRKIAMCHIMGQTSTHLQEIKKQLVSCLAACEAFIDFQQDELDVKADLFDKTKQRAISIQNKIKQILSRRKQIQTISNGINLVIIGKPNAGKSTIMNKMVRQQVAIVSDEPGTTRDIIKMSFEYKGIQFNLLDTAGIRQTQQKIQKQGIRRALQKVKYSHLNLLIIDGSQQQIVYKQQLIQINLKQFLNQQILDNQKTIIILNKIDLMNIKSNKQIKINYNGKSRIVNKSISALHQSNIQQIIEYVYNKCNKIYNIQDHQDQIYLTRERHFQCLEQCLGHLEEYLKNQKVDMASEQLRLAIVEIGKILGRIDCQDVLDVLFKDFCIGK